LIVFVMDRLRFFKNVRQMSANDMVLGFFMVLVFVLGVLKGYELLMDARVRNLADQVVKIQSSYFKFIDFYRQIPGDWRAAEASIVIPGIQNGGNGNGVLDMVEGDPWVESLAVWEHLQKANFLDIDRLGESSLKGKGIVKVPFNAFGAPMSLFSSRDYYDPSGTSVFRVGLLLGEDIPVSVLAGLDKKIDDGYPGSGVIRFVAINGKTFGEHSQSGGTCVDESQIPPVWITNNPETKCNGIHLY